MTHNDFTNRFYEIEDYIRKLDHYDSETRSESAYILGELGAVNAVKPLIMMLMDNVKTVRQDAVQALVKIGEPSLEDLISVLGYSCDEHEFNRWLRARCILDENIYSRFLLIQNIIEVMEKILEDEAGDKIVLRDVEPVDILICTLNHSNPFVKMASASALYYLNNWQLKSKKAHIHLLRALTDLDVSNKDGVIKTLGKLQEEEIIEDLIFHLKYGEEHTKEAAAQILSMYSNSENLIISELRESGGKISATFEFLLSMYEVDLFAGIESDENLN